MPTPSCLRGKVKEMKKKGLAATVATAVTRRC